VGRAGQRRLGAWVAGWVGTAALAIGAGPAISAVPAVATASATAPAARVQTMLVGRTATLFAPARVSARAGRLRVGRRVCAVAANTPLAVLIAARRLGGPAFRTRDYGHCTRSARNGGSLFVYQVGPDRNRGRDGWVYKVDGHIGTTGAADPAGPLGDGRRLRGGQRVVWFWCTLSARETCQPTLELAPSAARVGPGSPVRVVVRADDDLGRRRPQPGAVVSLGTATAVTAGDGSATVTAPPAAGAYLIRARAAGLVDAFPEELRVG